ncbi:MAG: phosphoribosylaminoimidazolesuccinocarboxamide synthase [Calditrichia bacterium]
MGSVKDLTIIQPADENKTGIGRFTFSDRYSVFDWGEMPDHIDNKGKAICITTAYFFEKLEQLGMSSHYLGLVEENVAQKLDSLKSPSHIMEFRMFRVIKPKLEGNVFNYSIYKTVTNNFLVPLEVIFRNSLPAGSSVFKRLKQGQLKLEDIGFTEMPEPGTRLTTPILDVSTKLENIDRYISWQEAQEISHLTDEEMSRMKEMTLEIDNLITGEMGNLGLYHEDGKIEFGMDLNRQLVLVDALGTLDECRFTYEGIPVSKEIARIYYRNSVWYKELEEIKKEDSVHWKEKVTTRPEPLPVELKQAISDLYCGVANELTGREWFKVPSLSDTLKTVKQFIG